MAADADSGENEVSMLWGEIGYTGHICSVVEAANFGDII